MQRTRCRPDPTRHARVPRSARSRAEDETRAPAVPCGGTWPIFVLPRAGASAIVDASSVVSSPSRSSGLPVDPDGLTCESSPRRGDLRYRVEHRQRVGSSRWIAARSTRLPTSMLPIRSSSVVLAAPPKAAASSALGAFIAAATRRRPLSRPARTAPFHGACPGSLLLAGPSVPIATLMPAPRARGTGQSRSRAGVRLGQCTQCSSRSSSPRRAMSCSSPGNPRRDGPAEPFVVLDHAVPPHAILFYYLGLVVVNPVHRHGVRRRPSVTDARRRRIGGVRSVRLPTIGDSRRGRWRGCGSGRWPAARLRHALHLLLDLWATIIPPRAVHRPRRRQRAVVCDADAAGADDAAARARRTPSPLAAHAAPQAKRRLRAVGSTRAAPPSSRRRWRRTRRRRSAVPVTATAQILRAASTLARQTRRQPTSCGGGCRGKDVYIIGLQECLDTHNGARRSPTRWEAPNAGT